MLTHACIPVPIEAISQREQGSLGGPGTMLCQQIERHEKGPYRISVETCLIHTSLVNTKIAYLLRAAAASAVSFKPAGASSRGMYNSTSYPTRQFESDFLR